jgi:hypothetical protein
MGQSQHAGNFVFNRFEPLAWLTVWTMKPQTPHLPARRPLLFRHQFFWCSNIRATEPMQKYVLFQKYL